MKTLLIIFLFLSSIAYSQDTSYAFKKYPYKSIDLEFPFGDGQSIIFKKFENGTFGISLFRGGMRSDFGVLSENQFEELKDFVRDGSGQGQQDNGLDSLIKAIENEIKILQQLVTKDGTDNIQYLLGKLDAFIITLNEIKKRKL